MWDLIVSVPDHCLSFYFVVFPFSDIDSKLVLPLDDFNIMIVVKAGLKSDVSHV